MGGALEGRPHRLPHSKERLDVKVRFSPTPLAILALLLSSHQAFAIAYVYIAPPLEPDKKLTEYMAGFGEPNSEYQLAQWTCAGKQGIKPDAGKAVQWFKRAVDHGHALAAHDLGVLYEFGVSVPRDHARALKLLRLYAQRSAAERPNSKNAEALAFADSARDIGQAYAEGDGRRFIDACPLQIQRDVSLAIWWLRLGADAFGAPRALGDLYLSEPGFKDAALARDWYQIATTQGDVSAMLTLGDMYSDGETLPRDDLLAIFWYRQASDNGNSQATLRLAQLYEQGRNDVADAGRVFHFYYCAYQSGSDSARTQALQSLSNVLASKLAAWPSDAPSVVAEAASQNPWAQVALGLQYDLGLGVPVRPNTAVALYRLAAMRERAAGFNEPNLDNSGCGFPSSINEEYVQQLKGELSVPANFDAALSASVDEHPVPPARFVHEILPSRDPADYYPEAARRAGHEARVLVEFNLDDKQRAVRCRVTQRDSPADSDVLSDAALRFVKGQRFVLLDSPWVKKHRRANPEAVYRVTVLLCLVPGHCDTMAPFPDTEPFLITARRLPTPYLFMD
jgi:hypothetical protein